MSARKDTITLAAFLRLTASCRRGTESDLAIRLAGDLSRRQIHIWLWRLESEGLLSAHPEPSETTGFRPDRNLLWRPTEAGWDMIYAAETGFKAGQVVRTPDGEVGRVMSDQTGPDSIVSVFMGRLASVDRAGRYRPESLTPIGLPEVDQQ